MFYWSRGRQTVAIVTLHVATILTYISPPYVFTINKTPIFRRSYWPQNEDMHAKVHKGRCGEEGQRHDRVLVHDRNCIKVYSDVDNIHLLSV